MQIKNLLPNDSGILNILTFPTHERYQQGLSLTGHNFFLYTGDHIKRWENKYGQLPNNHVILPEKRIPSDIKFDLVLSQNKFGQYPVAKKIADLFNLPLISLEHTLPLNEWDDNIKNQLKTMVGDINVFISDYSIKQWGFTDVKNTTVIHHMVDSDRFKPRNVDRQNTFLSVVNDWINRDHCCGFSIWKSIVDKTNIPVRVLGDTPGLSKPANSLQELSETYSSCKFFINTSTVSPIPTALLEAMSSGCICISTSTCMIPEIIKHGVNGFISNDINELVNLCKMVLNDPASFEYIGLNARETVLKDFSKEVFISKWNTIFQSVICTK